MASLLQYGCKMSHFFALSLSFVLHCKHFILFESVGGRVVVKKASEFISLYHTSCLKKPTTSGRVLKKPKSIYFIGSRRSCVVRVPYALPPVRHPSPFTFPPERPRCPWFLTLFAGAGVCQMRSVPGLALSGSWFRPDVPGSL